MPSFHNSLDHDRREIRILELEPASNSQDAIRCGLKTVSLSQSLDYMVLSYVWGQDGAKEWIHVDGAPFHATTNLCAALRRMRSDDSPLALWIDAICINQDDNDEKSRQILLMRDIYQSATTVIIWLGEQDDDSYRAMQTLYATAEVAKNASVDEDFKRRMILYSLEQDGTLGALGRFFLRPWWTRAWVIQEAAVARTAMFMCGGKPLDWQSFLGAYFTWTTMLQSAVRSDQMSPTLQLLQRIIDGTSARVIMWQYIRMHRTLPQPQLESAYGLQGMLEESWNFDSTDPRDKIYAWLGLQDSADIVIKPDYGATPTHVYTSLVKSFLEWDRSLRLIAFTGLAVREARPLLEGLPTWAPDLRKSARGTPEQAPYWLRPKSFKASADEAAVATISNDLKMLESDCIRIGQLDSVEASAHEMTADDVNDTLCHILYFVLRHSSADGSDAKDLHDTLFRTLVYYWNDDFLGLSAEGHQAQQLDMQHMMLGYTAYIGYLDRTQDQLEESHSRAAQDTKTYLLRTIEARDPQTGEVRKTVVLGSATDTLPKMIRQPSQKYRTPLAQTEESITAEQPSRKPATSDYANITRFFQMFGLNMAELSEEDTFISLLHSFLSDHNFTWTNTMHDWPSGGESIRTMMSTLKNRMERFVTRFVTVVNNKTFFHTDSGYIGLGLKSTQAGDYICIIRGCTVPLIIRARDDGQFEVVGQCYVWGAMYGESLSTMSDENQKWERLRFV